MPRDFDPFAALEHSYKEMSVAREMVAEAINLIENDRPHAAKRHLMSILEFGVDKRLREKETT